jgi:hypothetical protein
MGKRESGRLWRSERRSSVGASFQANGIRCVPLITRMTLISTDLNRGTRHTFIFYLFIFYLSKGKTGSLPGLWNPHRST